MTGMLKIEGRLIPYSTWRGRGIGRRKPNRTFEIFFDVFHKGPDIGRLFQIEVVDETPALAEVTK